MICPSCGASGYEITVATMAGYLQGICRKCGTGWTMPADTPVDEIVATTTDNPPDDQPSEQ